MYNVEFAGNEFRIRYFDSDGSILNTSNPTTYTPDSEDITLTNPTKSDDTFIGWTGTGLTEPTEHVTIPSGRRGDREYIANRESAHYHK